MTSWLVLCWVLLGHEPALLAPPATPQEPTESTPPESTPSPDVLQEAENHVMNGEPLAAAGLLLRHLRGGAILDRARAATVLVRAADELHMRGDIKAAAVAADAAWILTNRAPYPKGAELLLAYARVLEATSPPEARGVAERARRLDPSSTEASNFARRLSGVETWAAGHGLALTGLFLSALSAGAFVQGLDVERELRGERHPTADSDGLLAVRTVAAWVAWPAAILGASAVVGGVTLVVVDDPGPAPRLPPLFPALSEVH